MLTQDINTALSEISNLHAQASEVQFMSQVVEILRRQLGFHFVGLYLVNDQTIMLRNGSGEIGKRLLSYKHQFQLTDNSSVSKVINTGELWAFETKYERPNWIYKTYRSPLPVKVRRNAKLSLQLVEETQVDWSFQSPTHPTPPGWEIYLPLRAKKQIFGTFQIHAWDLSEATRKRAHWSSPLVDLDETREPVRFVEEDISALQELADQLSMMIKSSL